MNGHRHGTRTPKGEGEPAVAEVVGLVGRDLTDPLFVELAEGLQHSLREDDRVLLMVGSHRDASRLREVLESLRAPPTVGAVVLGDVGRPERLSRIARLGLPLVVVGDCVETPNVARVGFDLEMVARLAVDHMAGSGRRRIGMIGLPTGSSGRSPTGSNFLAAVTAAGVDGAVVRSEATLEGGRAALRDLIEGFPGMDGVLVHNDLMATGAVREAESLGIPVPAGVAVVSADDTGLGPLVIPALTSVRIDRDRLVEVVTDSLAQLIDTPGRRLEPAVVPVELIVRESA